MPKKDQSRHLYVQDEYWDQLHKIAAMLSNRGLIGLDNKNQPSLSSAIKFMIADEYKRLIEPPVEPPVIVLTYENTEESA